MRPSKPIGTKERCSSTSGIKTYTFGQLPINTGSLSELDACIRKWMLSPVRPGRLVGYLNPHIYNFVEREPIVRSFIQACDLVCVDGVGIVLAFRVLFGQAPPRVIATSLFDCALDWSDLRVNAVLIGGTAIQAQLAAASINARRGALSIVSAFHGFMHADEYKAVLRKYSGVDVVLVGAGTPKSEHILMHARDICKEALCWHIGGGTVGIYAGVKARAPRWISAVGAEWIHRFVLEPHYRSRVYPQAFEFAKHVLTNRLFPKHEVEQ